MYDALLPLAAEVILHHAVSRTGINNEMLIGCTFARLRTLEPSFIDRGLWIYCGQRAKILRYSGRSKVG